MQTIIFASKDLEGNFKRADLHFSNLFSKYASSPDFYKISRDSEKSKISIDDVKKAISFVSIKPSYCPYKFVLIENAQYLSIEAQNALLKILEEPPIYALFILTVDHVSNLIQTITSRSKIFQSNDKDVKAIIQAEYESIISEFGLVYDKSLGERLDWASTYRVKFTDRDFTSGFVDNALVYFHSLISTSGDVNNIKSIKKSVSKLLQIKTSLVQTNANPFLCIESFLASI